MFSNYYKFTADRNRFAEFWWIQWSKDQYPFGKDLHPFGFSISLRDVAGGARPPQVSAGWEKPRETCIQSGEGEKRREALLCVAEV